MEKRPSAWSPGGLSQTGPLGLGGKEQERNDRQRDRSQGKTQRCSWTQGGHGGGSLVTSVRLWNLDSAAKASHATTLGSKGIIPATKRSGSHSPLRSPRAAVCPGRSGFCREAPKATREEKGGGHPTASPSCPSAPRLHP